MSAYGIGTFNRVGPYSNLLVLRGCLKIYQAELSCSGKCISLPPWVGAVNANQIMYLLVEAKPRIGNQQRVIDFSDLRRLHHKIAT